MLILCPQEAVLADSARLPRVTRAPAPYVVELSFFYRSAADITGVRLAATVPSPEAEAFLNELCDLARFPSRVERLVLEGAFDACLEEAPIADVNVIGLPPNPTVEFLEKRVQVLRSTCICVRDSGRESALV